MLEDVFRLNVSAAHQLVSAVFVVVSAYRVRVFAFFISCFEKLASQCAFAQVTRINTVAVGCNDKALGLKIKGPYPFIFYSVGNSCCAVVNI
jgi:hypothetical protein